MKPALSGIGCPDAPTAAGYGDRTAVSVVKDAPLELAIIVPVLNEVDNVRPLHAALTKTLVGINWEVVYVDDGSTDGTIETLDDLASTHREVHAIKRYAKKGLASAVVDGVSSTSAQVIAVVDGDMQHDETQLPAMYAKIAGDLADMVIGSRYTEGGSVEGWDETRLKGSQFATRVTNMLLPTKCTDPMSGFFAMRRDAFMEIVPNLSAIGFKIVLDSLVTAKCKLRVAEQPYHFRTRQFGESKMSVRVVGELALFFVDKTIGRFLPTRLILFLLVGGLGVGVHMTVLWLGLTFGLIFAVAQALAVCIAIAFNFTLNNALTYADRQLRGFAYLRGLASFYLVCGTGAIANVGVGDWLFAGQTRWWVAGMAGAAVGAVWNYAASSLITWRRK